MGGIVSYLVGGNVVAPQEGEEAPSILNLVNPTHFDPDTPPQIIWNSMRQRVQAHPEEAAAYARSIDSSPLYRAMQLAFSKHTVMPVDLVRLFLEAYEEAAIDTPSSGETLLFVAAYGASLALGNDDNNDALETVKLLMDYNPEGVSQTTTQSKMLPVHHVRSNGEIATLLLKAYPQGSIATDVVGRLALHHVCSGEYVRRPSTTSEQQDEDVEQEANNEQADEDTIRLALTCPDVVTELVSVARQEGIADGGILTKDSTNKTPLDLLCEEIAGEINDAQQADKKANDSSHRVATLWKSLEFMVRAVSSQDSTSDGEYTFRMVHAVIALNCSPAIVAHALSLHPEQAGERDSKGCTPLTLAALSLEKVHPAVICTLLKEYPEAACMTDADGRLPIDIIAESSKYDEELWEALVKAEPRAVDTRDLRDKMFPFMTAAVGDKSNMNSVYRLLRAKPHVLSYFNLE